MHCVAAGGAADDSRLWVANAPPGQSARETNPGKEAPMSDEEIRAIVKQAIAKVTKLDPLQIGDDASYRDELGLDSLSILETIVEVQCRFRIPDLPEGEYAHVRTVNDTVRF